MAVAVAPGGSRTLRWVVVAALALVVVLAGSTSTAQAKKVLNLSPHHRTVKWHCRDSCDRAFFLRYIGKRYLRRHFTTLAVSIHWKKDADNYALELDNGHGEYVRSSQADTPALKRNPEVQRVAVHLRPGTKITHKFTASTTADQAGKFHGRARLIHEKKSHLFPSAGFKRTNLSLASKGPIIGAGEPSIAIGPTKTIHVTAPASTPAGAGTDPEHEDEPEKGVLYFRRAHGKGKWHSSNIGGPTGGGDSDVVADEENGIYVQDLSLAPSTILQFKSVDDGKTFADQLPFTLDADREWAATYNPGDTGSTDEAIVYSVYHGLANQEPIFCSSTNGGTTTNCIPGITDPLVQLNAAENTDQGNVVVESDGDADFLFATSTPAENTDPNAPSPGVGALHNLYLGHYDKTTGLITNSTVYLGPEGNWITGLFPVLAIDKDDNLYASWPESPSDSAGQAAGPWVLKIAHSTDEGQTWSDPDVMNPPKLHNNLLNWITVGDDGQVDVVWAGTTAKTNQYDSRARWFMFVAQSENGLSNSPDFTYRQITPHPIRYGNVCVLGLFCPGDDSRSLLDFAQVEVDKKCRANVVYGDISTYIPALHRRNEIFRGDGTSTDYALQRKKGFPICQNGGAGGAGSFDFEH